MADINALLEAEKRGLLPPQMKGALDEARKRGLINGAQPGGFMSGVNDTVNQLGTGMYQGLAGMASSLSDQSQGPRHPVAGRAIPGAESYVQTTIDPKDQTGPTYEKVTGFMQNQMGIPFAEPQTTSDRMLQAVGRGAGPGALFGPAGIVGGVVGGGASQTAREFNAPRWVEIAAGLGLPLLAGGIGAAWRRTAPSAQRQLGQALQDVTEQEMRAAEGLMRQSQQAGNPVTWSEALNQVSNGRFGQLAGLQRVVEQSPGSNAMSNIMSQRLEQSRGQAQRTLDAVGPQPQGEALQAVPYRVQGAANQAIQGERDITNTLSRPAYNATTGDPSVTLPPQAYQRLQQQYPNLPDAIAAVRADPIRYGNLNGLADDSYAVLDQAKKYLDDVASASQRAGQNYGASNAGGMSNAITDSLSANNPRYGSALNIQSIRQRHVEEPLRRGQVGQLSGEGEASLAGQRQKLLPIGKQETVDPQTVTATVQRLEQEAPGAARDWLRTNLQSEFDEVMKAFKTAGADQSRGASLWAHLAGNEGRRANLRAYVDALDPSGQTWRGFERMLQTLDAQRYRLPANSATAFNQETISALKGKGIPVSLEDLNPVSAFQGEVKQASQLRRYRINSERLAEILIDPEAGARLRALAGMNPSTQSARLIIGGLLSSMMPADRRDE